MSKCHECGLLAWRPGCTAGGGDDFNTYVNFDDDSNCPSFRRAKRKPLMDELAKALRMVWSKQLPFDHETGTWGSTIYLIPSECRIVLSALARYQKEVSDGL